MENIKEIIILIKDPFIFLGPERSRSSATKESGKEIKIHLPHDVNFLEIPQMICNEIRKFCEKQMPQTIKGEDSIELEVFAHFHNYKHANFITGTKSWDGKTENHYLLFAEEEIGKFPTEIHRKWRKKILEMQGVSKDGFLRHNKIILSIYGNFYYECGM